jgi:hypothetical protein
MCVVLERLSVLSVPLPGSWADRSPLHEAACHGRLLALRTLLSQVSHTQRGGALQRKANPNLNSYPKPKLNPNPRPNLNPQSTLSRN